jgi:hypothetical protein
MSGGDAMLMLVIAMLCSVCGFIAGLIVGANCEEPEADSGGCNNACSRGKGPKDDE